MTIKTSRYAVNQVFTSRQSQWGRFEFAVRQRPSLSAYQRTPPNGEGDAGNQNGDNNEQSEKEDLLPIMFGHVGINTTRSLPLAVLTSLLPGGDRKSTRLNSSHR